MKEQKNNNGKTAHLHAIANSLQSYAWTAKNWKKVFLFDCVFFNHFVFVEKCDWP